MSTPGREHHDQANPASTHEHVEPDAVDLLAREDRLMRGLLETWHTGGAGSEPVHDAVTENWDRGTVGKLLLEHGAVRLAAAEEVRDALASSDREDLAGQVGAGIPALRVLLDEMDEAARGVNGVALATTARFCAAVEELDQAILASALPMDAIRLALRDAGGLHTSRYIRVHAPTHPGRQRWYSHVPPLVRVHAAYDRLRGFPWARNGPYTDAELADRLEERDDRPGQAD